MTDYDVTADVRGNFATMHITPYSLNEETGTLAHRYQMDEFSDEDMTSRFKAALKKLESLMYAVYGSVPDFAGNIQWQNGTDPRCLWPEQGVEINNDAVDRYRNYYEFASKGHHYPPTMAIPTVSLQTRSGDHRLQSVIVDHHPMFQPTSAGVQRVWRSGNDEVNGYDPESNAVGYSVPVTIYVQPDTTVGTPSLVELHYSTGGAPTVIPMPWDSLASAYTAVIPSQDDDTTVWWFISATYDPGSGDITIYDGHASGDYESAPTLATPPTDPHTKDKYSAYTYVAFHHTNPYLHGLPELLHEDTPALLRGTDQHTFDKMESIQPGLINVARFCLQEMGAVFNQNPTNRWAGDDGRILCCLLWPIEWRWSGSNISGFYLKYGKGESHGVQPLHNHPTQPNAGVQEKRMWWRGIPWVFKSDPLGLTSYGFEGENYYFGGDESWETLRSYCVSETIDGATVVPDGACRATSGLRAGDEIDRVHLEEIIQAVNYIFSDGLWTTNPAPTFPKKPGPIMGRNCGEVYSEYCDINGEIQIFDNYTYYGYPYDQCSNYTTAPTLTQCEQNPGACGVCHTMAYHWTSSEGQAPCTGLKRYTYQCQPTVFVTGFAGGGKVWNWCCDHPTVPDLWLFQCEEEVYGWSAYYCPPARNKSGFDPVICLDGAGDPDLEHGNGATKIRYEYNLGTGWEPGYISTSMGNSFDRVHICGDAWNPTPPSNDFTTIKSVDYAGVATGWFDKCSAPVGGCGGGHQYSAIPGLGYYNVEGEPICNWVDPEGFFGGTPPNQCLVIGYPASAVAHDNRCGVDMYDFGACFGPGGLGCYAWVRVDLNTYSDDNGDTMARLKNYPLTLECSGSPANICCPDPSGSASSPC